jgi:farnesyl-diphosphate farnesyltransferase
MSPARRGPDLEYADRVLPRVSRTFAANIGVLRGPLRDAVTVAYLLCRAADALEDSWPGPPDAIAARFGRLLDALAGDAAAAADLAAQARACAAGREDLELVAHLPVVLRAYSVLDAADRHAIGDAVKEMARGMRRYAVRAAERAPGGGGEPAPYLDTEAELHDYCYVVAGCVGVMLTRMFDRRALAEEAVIAERLLLAPIVGEALQLTNILLDWPRDLRRGRCYVPAEWLAQYHLTPAGLTDPSRAGGRAAAKRREALARAALGQVPEYLDAIPSRHWRYRMFVLWPALWAQASLRHAFRDPEFPLGERRPRLPRGEVLAIARRALLFGHSRQGVRRLFASLA